MTIRLRFSNPLVHRGPESDIGFVINNLDSLAWLHKLPPAVVDHDRFEIP